MQWINNSLIHIILNTLQICLKKKSRINLLICLIKVMNVILSSEPWSKGLKLLINCLSLGRCNFLKWMINLSFFKLLHFLIGFMTINLRNLMKEKISFTNKIFKHLKILKIQKTKWYFQKEENYDNIMIFKIMMISY